MENSSLNNFKSAIDNHFYDFRFMLRVNFCLLYLIYICIYVIEWVYRVFSLNPNHIIFIIINNQLFGA